MSSAPEIAGFRLLEPLCQRPGRLVARVPGGELHLAHPPSRLVRSGSAFGGAAAEFFGPGAPGCGVRFEARVLAHLTGVVGVPQLLGHGTHEGAAWFVRTAPTGAPPTDPVAWARDLLNLLARLHARGVVHRSLRPACVLPGPHLVDFEGATLGDDGIPGRVGTPSPEQIAHALGAPLVLDHRVDLYALGRLLGDAVPAPPAALARLIEALLRPRPTRPPTAEAALAVLAGGPLPEGSPPPRFAEALRVGDPEAALALARTAGEHRRVAHLAAALGALGGLQASAWRAEARAALAQVKAPGADLSLVVAQLADTPEAGEAALQQAIQNAHDSAVLAASIEAALASGALGLAAAAAVRALAMHTPAGVDLLRHVIGRLLVIETRVGDAVAEALVTACVALALGGGEAPTLVRRSFERAVEAGAGLLRGQPSPEAAVLLATAGAALDAPWVDPLLAYARRADTQGLEIKRESLRALALAQLGLTDSSTPATPW